MESCRWASYIRDPLDKIDEELVTLPEAEQVSRGMELMMLLREPQDSLTERQDSPRKPDVEKSYDGDWNVIVKQTFIEVVIPQCSASRRRAATDSALTICEKTGQAWNGSAFDKAQDVSDASTDASLEADPVGANAAYPSSEIQHWPTDCDTDVEHMVQPVLPFQYVETWWVPANFDVTPQTFHPINAGGSFDQVPSEFDFDQGLASMNPNASVFVAPQWTDHADEVHGADVELEPEETRTTVMIRNMPNNYTRDMLLELIDSMGLIGTYDFVYLPVDFRSQAGLGYAFVNFCTVSDALECFDRLEGFSDWKVPSEKVCSVTWSAPTQGLEEHIERYRNSPVMHPSLPDKWKPLLFRQGTRIAFPPPTRPLKTPTTRKQASNKAVQS